MLEHTPLMRLEGVTKSYGSNQVIRNLSFSLFEGTSILIQGPSGCGKTTLLRCMALLETIDSGCIELSGQKILGPKIKPKPERGVRLGIGMVFQHIFLWPHLTVIENVALPLWLVRGGSKKSAMEEARAMLDLLNVLEKELEYPVSLSGGQQQRVALARALVHSPKILLLDEITSNLDDVTSGRVLDAVESIWKRGTVVVLASHHADQIPDSLKKIVFRFEKQDWNISILLK